MNATAQGFSRRLDCTGSLGIKNRCSADIDKISGWRLHLQYEDGEIHLKDVIEGQKHEDVLREIEAKKIRYAKKRQ